MSNLIKFSSTALLGTGKKGIIKPDEDGYYEVVLGGLNVFNSVGQFYVYEQAKSLFESSSLFMRRVKSGKLRGENGHPKSFGMKKEQFFQRVMSIYEENVSHHIKEVWLNFDEYKNADGTPMIAIMGKVKPCGPMGKVVQEALDNPEANCCFSIRSLTEDFYERGIEKRVLKTIITWDYVNEPGIAIAEKYKAPALESFDVEQFSRSVIERSMRESKLMGIGQESAILTTNELLSAMGWETGSSGIIKPASLNW